MDVLISQDEKGGRTVLTTDSPMSHDGIPVLRIEVEDIGVDFLPTDIVAPGLLAAYVVKGWATKAKALKPDARAAAVAYLKQWPDGPQIDPA